MMRAAVLATAALALCTAASLSAHKTVVSTFTYYRDIRPLFERSCASCHDRKSVAPSLLRYDDAAAAYPAIERALLAQDRAEHGAQLTHLDFDRIMTWAAGGTPEGDRPPGAPAPPRRHATHAGQLGGLLVPLAGDTLHAEAVFSEQRRLRLFVTTTTGDPVTTERLRGLRIATRTADGSETPFVVTRSGDALEARLPTVALPATFVIIDRNGDAATPPSVIFSSYSIAPAELEIPPTELPALDSEFVAAIEQHAVMALKLVAESQYGQVYLPTTHVRDLLIAMKTADANRDRALGAMMRANWALHLAGDNGLRSAIYPARQNFETALRGLVAAYRN